MTISATELLEVAPKDPAYIVVIGPRIVTVNANTSTPGTVPNGSFAVLNTSTETARVFTGLTTSTGHSRLGGVVTDGTYAYAYSFNGTGVWRINPVDGGIATLSGPGGDGGYGEPLWGGPVGIASGYMVLLALDGWGWGSRRINLSDGSSVSVSGTFGYGYSAIASAGGYVYARTYAMGGFLKLDLPANAIVGTWPSPAVAGYGLEYSGKLWFGDGGTGLHSFNLTTNLWLSYSHASLGAGNNTASFTQANGWLFNLTSTGYLLGFNPATGAWGAELLPSSRTHRYGVVGVGSKLWSPAGDPLT